MVKPVDPQELMRVVAEIARRRALQTPEAARI
jgi:hypothetical protein